MTGLCASCIHLAEEIFGRERESYKKSGAGRIPANTHQFTGHPLPGRNVLSQVNFPKGALGHETRAWILVGQLPWKQENVQVDLIAAFLNSHVLLHSMKTKLNL